jgi:hypothetical protein
MMTIKVGLVSRDKLENKNEICRILDKISLAYGLYVSTNLISEIIARGFKDQDCFPICIDFFGVWCVSNLLQLKFEQADVIDYRDTVASVGLLRSQTLPFVDANSSIRVFRQALSLDEVRGAASEHIFRLLTPFIIS